MRCAYEGYMFFSLCLLVFDIIYKEFQDYSSCCVCSNYLVCIKRLPILFFFGSRAIVKNSDLLPSTPWSNVLFNDFWGTPLTHSGSHKSYRPICVATFRINYYYGALNPFGYHLVNVLLHSTVCWLVVVLSYTFFHAHFPSLVAGLLFAVHPIHTGKIALHASIL